MFKPRIKNKWFLEFLVARLKISDPPSNTGKNSEFLIPQTTKERIQNFWSPKNTTKDSEFLIPKEHRKGFSISDPPKIQNFWSSTMTHKRIQNFWSPTHKMMLNLWSPTKAQKSIQSFWSPKEHRRRFRISDPPRNMAGKGFRISDLPLDRIPNFLSPKNIVSRGIRISPKQPKRKKIFFSLGSESEVKYMIIVKGFWGKLKND